MDVNHGDNCFDRDCVGEAEVMMPDFDELPLAKHAPEASDEHTGAKVMFPHGSEHVQGVVKARASSL